MVTTNFVATCNFEFWYGITSSGGGWNYSESDLFKSLKKGDKITVKLCVSPEKFPQRHECDIEIKFLKGSCYTYSFVIGVYVTQGKLKQVD